MSEYRYYRPKKKLRGVPPRTRLSEANLDLMGIPHEFWRTTLQDVIDRGENVKALKVVKAYVDDIHTNYEEGIGLFLFGSNGVGKTEIASIVLKEAYRHRYTAKFTTMTKMTPIGVKAGYDEDIKAEYYAYYLNVDFLVIDEVGKEPQGEKAANLTVLDEVLRHRNMRQLPTIVITNLDTRDFQARYGESIYSLIFARFIDIKIVTEDKRKTVRHKQLLKRILEGAK